MAFWSYGENGSWRETRQPRGYRKNRPGSGSRGGRRSRRTPHNQGWIRFALGSLFGIAFLGGASGTAYVVYDDLHSLKPDKIGCYATSNPQDVTVALVDSSEPRFDTVQSRDLLNAFEDVYRRDLTFNEKFSVIVTDPSRIGTVPDPVIELCGSASSSAELEEIGANGATQAYLDRQQDKIFEDRVGPTLEEVFSTDAQPGRIQNVESPIMEQIQSVSRLRNFSGNAGERTLILVSDLIQATREVQFCTTKGHLPSFTKFKTRAYFDQVRPRSLAGVDVKIYMLVRPGLGEEPLQYCTERELVDFWQAYFKNAQAASVEIIRLRDGAYVQSGQ
ncbi:hypothetical protein [uncultured Roseibium sp.]|uniref:hypothetical protein n=1 Tax=uncultured Roseibium sp. TaxID=1936171 RepID=UPI002635D2C7|nr:hypothetical protein [uncultured Roseibium sp.]